MLSIAAQVAQQLAAKFLHDGNFAAAIGMKGNFAGIIPAQTLSEVGSFFLEQDYAGLSVQAVGYEEGGPEEKVHVYVSKGGRKAIQEIETRNGTVKVEVDKIGRLMIRPEQANSSTNKGNVYRRKNRVACGSSCAPVGESYSGTLGALVRKKKAGDKNLYLLSNNHVLAACNHTPVGMPIMSLSNEDGASLRVAPVSIGKGRQPSVMPLARQRASRRDLRRAYLVAVDAPFQRRR